MMILVLFIESIGELNRKYLIYKLSKKNKGTEQNCNASRFVRTIVVSTAHHRKCSLLQSIKQSSRVK